MRRAILNRLFSIFLISSVFLTFAPGTGYGAPLPVNSNPEIIVQGPAYDVELMTFSKDGRLIATSCQRTVNVWQFSDLKLLRTFTTPHPITALAFSPDGKILATAISRHTESDGPQDSEILLWRVPDGVIITRYPAYSHFLLFTKNGNELVEYDDKIIVREISSNKIVRHFNYEKHDSFTGNIALNENETLLATATGKFSMNSDNYNNNMVIVWDFQTGKLVKTFEGHQDRIDFVAFTPSNEIISSSKDKTTRLWSLREGKQIKLFKEDPKEQDRDVVSQILWASFNSNKGLSAILGKDNRNIIIRDIQSGQVINSLQDNQKKQISEKVSSEPWYLSFLHQIAFTSDGKFLAGGSPLKIWALPNGNQIGTLGFSESNSGDSSLAFTHDCKMFSSASKNGVFGFWDISNAKLGSLFGRPTKKIRQMGEFERLPAFNEEGNLLAAIDNKNFKKINLINVLTGNLINSIEHNSVLHFSSNLSFNKDSKILALIKPAIEKTPEIKLWSMPDGTPLRAFNRELSNCLSAIVVNKSLICYYKDNTIKLWRISDGSLEKTISKSIPLKPSGGNLYTNRDGTILAAYSVSETKNLDNRLIIDLWSLPDCRYLKRILNDIEFYTSVRSIFISPDKSFMSINKDIGDDGTENSTLYRIADGEELLDFDKHFFPIFTPDGKFVIANFQGKSYINVIKLSDSKVIQTITENGNIALSKDGKLMGIRNHANNTDELWLWKGEAGKEGFEKVLSMRYQDDGEYVVYTPDGYYDRSPEAINQIYWTFPNGRFPESFSFEQLESVYRRPDIIKARLAGNLNAGKPAPPATRPPYVEMAEHRELKETEGSTYPLKLTASALDEVKTLRIFVNGKSTMDIPIGAKEKDLTLDVPLSPGMNRISAIAYNQKGFSSNTKYMDVLCKRTDAPKPNLYVIGIGVSEYAMLPKEWQLSSAHSDAKSIIKAFKSQEGKIFGRVETRLLTNAEASVEAITDAFKSLESVKENDLAVIFLAGHGIMSKDEVFYFLTPSGDLEKPEKGGISWNLLGDALNKVKGRVLVLLDACHSGNISTQVIVPNDELAQKLRSEGKSGIMVFSASKGRQSALEDVEGGFGVFAHAITQSLGPESKQADTNGNGFVEFMELVDYVRKKVDKETEGDQTPWLSRKELFGDFAISSVLK